MTISFKNQTVIVERAATIVERGDTLLDWSNTSDHELSGCRLQPMATDEVLFTGAEQGGVARDAVITRWKLFGPYDGDLTARDRVQFEGTTYEVDGQVQRWRSPTGVLDHLECVLRLVEG